MNLIQTKKNRKLYLQEENSRVVATIAENSDLKQYNTTRKRTTRKTRITITMETNSSVESAISAANLDIKRRNVGKNTANQRIITTRPSEKAQIKRKIEIRKKTLKRKETP